VSRHWVVPYRWSLATLCRISCGLRWCGQSRNRKKKFNMADVCFCQTETVISRLWFELPWHYLVCWQTLTFWRKWRHPIWYGNKIAPQRPPSWKSIRRHISAASDPILVKCGMQTQNDFWQRRWGQNRNWKRWRTEYEKLLIGRAGSKSGMLLQCKSVRVRQSCKTA